MKAKIHAVEPRLPVADLRRSLGFYRKLGFQCADQPDEATELLVMQRDDIALQLVPVDTHHPSCAITLWFDVDDAQHELGRLRDEVTVEWGPEDFSYGRREFAVLDPDGHRLIFSAPAKSG